MASSQDSPSGHRRPPNDALRVAPYLTHVVAHHGQLTLIPPQNAGRIRKGGKKRKQAVDDDAEPRFTTAVPPSSSRKLHPAPRTRKQAIITHDVQSIPDYPPPSFEDAIASAPLPSPATPSDSPALSQVSLSTSAPASSNSTSLTCLNDMPLLRPPQSRSVPHSSIPHPALHHIPHDLPPPVPYRLTSPSTTTLLSSAHAIRHSPSHPDLTPPPPHTHDPPPHSPSSLSTASDVFEDFTWEPRQRWSADRRLGLSLEQRVQREFDRRNTEETLSAFAGNNTRAPVDSHTRRCSYCGSLRPLECGDIQSINEATDEATDEDHDPVDDNDNDNHDNNDDDDDDDVSSSHSPIPHVEKGKSPYLHPISSLSKATLLSRTRSQLRFRSQSPEPTSPSPPASPMSPTTPFFKMPTAWASSVSLSLSTAFSHSTDKAVAAGLNHAKSQSLKRKESFGVKRLFDSLKGKDRERDHTHASSVSSTVTLHASSLSSSDSSSASESMDGWEVVSVESESVSSAHSPYEPTRGNSVSSTPSPTVSPSSPTSESARQAFLHRPVRPRALLDSPTTPTSPHFPLPSTPVTPAASRPFLPEKSPLRKLRQAQTGAANALPSMAAPPTAAAVMTSNTRTVRPSPSVVWKAPSPVSRSPLSHTPTSASPVRPSPLGSSPVCHSPIHSTVAVLSRSETYALRHQSAPLPPTVAMAMSRDLNRSPSPVLASPSSPSVPSSPWSFTADAAALEKSGPAHIRRRRAITPPPSHRRAMLTCDTNAISSSTLNLALGLGLESVAIDEEVEEQAEAGGDDAESESAAGCASIEQQLMTHVGVAAPEPAIPAPPTGSSVPPVPQTAYQYHYRGRPLPRLPVDAPTPTPVKRVPDGYPVNRMPEVSVPPAPPPPPPASMRVAPPSMERSVSGESVLEDPPVQEDRPFSQVTDLDVLASRAVEGVEGVADGRNYEELLLVSEVLGQVWSGERSDTNVAKSHMPVGTVEVKRRRVLKDGRVKLKLELLDVPVDRCGACLSQFRRGERGALTPLCKHSFHEVCLRRWLRTARACPICRTGLSLDG